MTQNKNYILKVLVGSRSHGLHNENSDYNYRGVYVLPTKDILSLGYNYKGSHWLEGDKEDQTAWEIGHFLQLAMKCNPTILEVFKAPIYYPESYCISNGVYGFELRDLFPYIWNPQDAYNAFVGYGLNQRRKMLDNHLERWQKYAIAYLRTLWNLEDLLREGTFSLEIKDEEFKNQLLQIKEGKWTTGQVIDMAEDLTLYAKASLETCKQIPDLTKVNDFLIKIRKEYWE